MYCGNAGMPGNGKEVGQEAHARAGVSVTLPTEPLAGDAKTTPIMAVMVQDDGTPILEYEIKKEGSPSSSASGARSRHSWSA